MKRILSVLALAIAFAALPAIARPLDKPIKAEGTLMDVMCGSGVKTQAEADEHKRTCALMDHCLKSGFGIVIDGTFHKFDAEGNKKAEAIFRSSTKENEIRATVVGTLGDDGSIEVEELTAL
jgi:hypothetical protein